MHVCVCLGVACSTGISAQTCINTQIHAELRPQIKTHFLPCDLSGLYVDVSHERFNKRIIFPSQIVPLEGFLDA